MIFEYKSNKQQSIIIYNHYKNRVFKYKLCLSFMEFITLISNAHCEQLSNVFRFTR